MPWRAEVGVAWTTPLEELLRWKPQIVAEAASVEAVKANAIAVLQGGADFVTLAIGAFADADFYEEVQAVARAARPQGLHRFRRDRGL